MTTDPYQGFRRHRVIPPVAPLDRQAMLSILIWFVYVFFVVYGSLVPLDFKPILFDQAWDVFQHIQMYQLGVESRADWVANGVLYVPVGFLSAYLLIQRFPDRQPLAFMVLAGLFSIALAVSVEFTQVFFPPRTVSLNDLLAETVGSFIGLLLAAKYSDWFKSLLRALLSDPGRLTSHLAEAYFLGYLAFSLFPYDILLSGAELEQKLYGSNWGWLIAGNEHGRLLAALKFLCEIILTIPFGLFLGCRAASPAVAYRQAVLAGVFLGCSIEFAQLFIASGVSEGVSVLTRIAGLCCGVALWQIRGNWTPKTLAALIWRYALPLSGIYLLILLQVNGWFSHHWDSPDVAFARLDQLHFMPFYYYYFTTEAKALFSLTIIVLMYLPIGLLTWAKQGSPALAFCLALFAVTFVESGKFFLRGLHPDPTNVILGALASWGGLHLAQLLSKAIAPSSQPEVAEAEIAELLSMPVKKTSATSQNMAAIAGGTNLWKRYATYTMLLPSLTLAAYGAATFPIQPALLCLFLATCSAVIWCRPALLVAIILAALPVLDFAQWSGRFYLDEFDLLLLVSLAIGYSRIPSMPRNKGDSDKLFAMVGTLLAISFAVSALRGLLPWQAPDANSFTNYYSPFNALRIGKGALWAFLGYGLVRRMAAAEMDLKQPLAIGMVSGLALTVGVILWERVAFSGLFNFSSDYRVTGPFSAMHTGGALIECFLAIATPFLVLLILETKNWVKKILGVTLLLASTYALMVTFSRNGYSAFGVALAIILFFALFKYGRSRQRSLLVVTLSGAMLAVAIPILTGQFAQDRIATVGKDYAVRQAHWEDALAMRSPDWLTTIFGMGLGRYPESHYLLSSEDNHSGTYQLVSEAQNIFLRLGSGSSIYLEQLVGVEPQQKYLLKLDARSNKPKATITIPVCEKWLLASYNCIWSTLEVGNEAGAWRHYEVQLSSDAMSISHWYSQRPIKLGLYNGNSQALIDVDNVRLETMQGNNLLLNGNFSEELDHWFFSADSHLQWHAKSMPIAVLFDQGWFGLLAVCVFSTLALKRAASRAWRGDLSAAVVLASFSAFLVVGLFDTLIDAPRFLFLLLALGGFCGFRERQHG